jgi:radical SAM superfamily enzyme YgiQ (UPF0313 family)
LNIENWKGTREGVGLSTFDFRLSTIIMKILLTTLNAKYVHTALALWTLFQYCRDEEPGLSLREFNINQDPAWITGEIYREKADVVAFSCNIWNIELLKIIGPRLKAVAPQTIFILGGPEVSTDPVEIMKEMGWADFVISGEGEATFREWLQCFGGKEPEWSSVAGLTYRNGDAVIQNETRPLLSDLGILRSPYPDDLAPFRRKLLYYETSRGCPFDCQYCLSANERGLRFFPWERARADLLRFIQAGVVQVKLVDRTFNADLEWAKRIWRFLIANPGSTNFHFEICGDLLDEESLAILKAAPAGLFQFEIGVQSTNPESLKLIQRRTNIVELKRKVKYLLKETNLFIHLDLIAGLPGEDYASFARSCNDALTLWPDRLQVGFLKLLKGSGLRARAAEYGYLFTPEAPYEVLAGRWLSYEELLRLKTIEDLIERYYNNRRFRTSLRYLMAHFANPFGLFEAFAVWWKERGLDALAHKTRDLYQYLLDYFETSQGERPVLREILKYDLLWSERVVELPEWTGPVDQAVRSRSFRFWQDPANCERFAPEFTGMTPREIERRTLFEAFSFDPEAAASASPGEVAMKEQVIIFIYAPAGTRVVKLAPEK